MAEFRMSREIEVADGVFISVPIFKDRFGGDDLYCAADVANKRLEAERKFALAMLSPMDYIIVVDDSAVPHCGVAESTEVIHRDDLDNEEMLEHYGCCPFAPPEGWNYYPNLNEVRVEMKLNSGGYPYFAII